MIGLPLDGADTSTAVAAAGPAAVEASAMACCKQQEQEQEVRDMRTGNRTGVCIDTSSLPMDTEAAAVDIVPVEHIADTALLSAAEDIAADIASSAAAAAGSKAAAAAAAAVAVGAAF